MPRHYFDLDGCVNRAVGDIDRSRHQRVYQPGDVGALSRPYVPKPYAPIAGPRAPVSPPVKPPVKRPPRVVLDGQCTVLGCTEPRYVPERSEAEERKGGRPITRCRGHYETRRGYNESRKVRRGRQR